MPERDVEPTLAMPDQCLRFGKRRLCVLTGACKHSKPEFVDTHKEL